MAHTTGAALLRQIMVERGLSQRDVETAIEAPQGGLVAKWISRENPRSPSLANAHRLEALYGIPTEAWLPDGVDIASASDACADPSCPRSLPVTGTDGA